MTESAPEFSVENATEGETVHQRCVLLFGQCSILEDTPDGFVSLQATDCFGKTSSAQNWPTSSGWWRALVMLSLGQNDISFTLHTPGGAPPSRAHALTLNYQPLLQLPPLHLAILVARDSPLLIDCPPAKMGALSSAHGTLDAAVAKLRMTAYMWQAVTAESMRHMGLGRRSFRLDEEWGVDTTSRAALQEATGARHAGMSARIYVVRCEQMPGSSYLMNL